MSIPDGKIRDEQRSAVGIPSPALLRPGGLLHRAESILQQRLAAHPHDAKALLRLGDVLRQKGEFPAAIETYRHLHALNPDHASAAWLVSMLSGGRVRPAAPAALRPVPFVRLAEFLTPAQQARLFMHILAGRERFRSARVGEHTLNCRARAALVSDRQTLRGVRSWFDPKLRSVLPHVLARLRMEGLHRFQVGMNVTVYLGGGFHKVHRDNKGKRKRLWKLNYVYYLHREPRRFAGGDLLLYDTNVEAGGGSSVVFSRIEPLNNSLVFFPSDAFHEVIPVACATQDFGDGRFSVNGWIRSCGEDEVAPLVGRFVRRRVNTRARETFERHAAVNERRNGANGQIL